MVYKKKSAVMCFYYLMAVDNDIQDIEKETFDSIAKEIDPEKYESYKDSISEEYSKQIETIIDEEDYYDVIVEGVDKYLVPKEKPEGVTSRLLLWDLLVVAFSDGEYSQLERKLIKHIVRVSEIEKSVFLEMEQLMKANDAVSKEIESLEKSDKPYNEIRPMIEELEERRNVIIESAKALIEDETYVPVAKVEKPEKDIFDKIGDGVSSTVTPIASSIGDGAKKLWGSIFK